jgi:predicted nucleic acid-binding protein
MIVVDTNVIAYLFISGDFTEKTKSLLFHDPEWIAPFLWRSEFRNILSLYIRKKYVDIDEALLIMNEAENFMNENEYEVNSKEILELVNNSNCSAYDCEFVALAKRLNLKLFTSDKKILKEFPQFVNSISDFSNN